MKRLILLCLLAWPAFADPLSDEKTRQVLAEGEVLRAGVRLWDKAVNFRTVEYEIRYKGEFYVCTIGWSEKKHRAFDIPRLRAPSRASRRSKFDNSPKPKSDIMSLFGSRPSGGKVYSVNSRIARFWRV